MPAPLQQPPPRRVRRSCAQGGHVADPATLRLDGPNRRAVCRRCHHPIVRPAGTGAWIASVYLG